MSEPWEHLAACAHHPTDWWFPERDTGRDNHGRQAEAICATCPALTPCLEAALERGEDHGIWGGAGGDQRRALARAWRQRHTNPSLWAAVLERHLRRLQGERLPPENRNGPNATHGLRVTYNRGCRCRPCRLAAIEDVAERSANRRPA